MPATNLIKDIITLAACTVKLRYKPQHLLINLRRKLTTKNILELREAQNIDSN